MEGKQSIDQLWFNYLFQIELDFIEKFHKLVHPSICATASNYFTKMHILYLYQLIKSVVVVLWLVFQVSEILGSFERNGNAKWIFELVSPLGVAELSGIQNKVNKILKVTKLRDGRGSKTINVLDRIHIWK